MCSPEENQTAALTEELALEKDLSELRRHDAERARSFSKALADEITRLRGLISEVVEDGGVQSGCLLFDELVESRAHHNKCTCGFPFTGVAGKGHRADCAKASPIRDNEQEQKP